MTDDEPTVRYWRDPGSGVTYPAADDTISGFYRDSRWTEVAVLTPAELDAIKADAFDQGWASAVDSAPSDVWFETWNADTNPYRTTESEG